ncbi:PEP-CTERM sorting domain-containing protein [Coraliomargarita parva]|uniref:PEP-CTERM sorting domain-containing protein n=1 Tax=Coraliomargarita parva TaxID=3014050 RepID=UPI0022B4B5D4|nr:PEP-CTERM sorting domain-containing protein [Coraliomargarita parva]
MIKSNSSSLLFLNSAAVAAFFASVTALHASPLLQESFLPSDGYSNTAAADAFPGDLKDQVLTGPSGFSGSWTGSTSLIQYNTANNLSYGSYAGLGGGVGFATPADSTARYVERGLSSALAFNGGTSSYYLSFMMDVSAVDATGMSYVSVRNNNPGSDNFAFGLGAGVMDGNFMLVNRNSSNTAEYLDLGTAYTTGTHLFVIKLDDGGDGNWDAGSDQMTIWIDPTDLSSEANATSSSLVYSSIVSTSGAGSFSMDEITMGANSFASAATIQYDEIVLGTSWSDVVVVPEPSTYALLFGFMGVAAMGLRRSQQGR